MPSAPSSFPEYADFWAYIATDGVRSAFQYLVEASHHLDEYEARPAPHGMIKRNYHYFKDGRSPFAFIVNKHWLLFYLRMPDRTHPRLSIADLKRKFSDVELKSGQITFKIRSVADAESAMRVVFGEAYRFGDITYPDDLASPAPMLEGAAKLILVNNYERNDKARKACIEHYGARCSVCDMSFKEHYGSLGADYIHVHHLVELSSIGKEYAIDPLRDLRPVCPNCHAMLHRRDPAFTIGELKKEIFASRRAVSKRQKKVNDAV